jgi:hypothetical protein
MPFVRDSDREVAHPEQVIGAAERSLNEMARTPEPPQAEVTGWLPKPLRALLRALSAWGT